MGLFCWNKFNPGVYVLPPEAIREADLDLFLGKWAPEPTGQAPYYDASAGVATSAIASIRFYAPPTHVRLDAEQRYEMSLPDEVPGILLHTTPYQGKEYWVFVNRQGQLILQEKKESASWFRRILSRLEVPFERLTGSLVKQTVDHSDDAEPCMWCGENHDGQPEQDDYLSPSEAAELLETFAKILRQDEED